MEIPDRLLKPSEVAEMFRVDSKTVTRWVAAGKFSTGVMVKTPGGHSRFWESKIREILGR